MACGNKELRILTQQMRFFYRWPPESARAFLSEKETSGPGKAAASPNSAKHLQWSHYGLTVQKNWSPAAAGQMGLAVWPVNLFHVLPMACGWQLGSFGGDKGRWAVLQAASPFLSNVLFCPPPVGWCFVIVGHKDSAVWAQAALIFRFKKGERILLESVLNK